jgi:dimeric dUTPase (all-alpha-NTP-PPase superfamily)
MEDRQSMSHLKLKPVPEYYELSLLESMFIAQEQLCCKYDFWKDLDADKSVTVYADYILSEAQELKNESNWKLHKKTKKTLDKEHAIYEYIDILHMVLSGLIKLGVSPRECYQYYMAKNKENRDRIKNGY